MPRGSSGARRELGHSRWMPCSPPVTPQLKNGQNSSNSNSNSSCGNEVAVEDGGHQAMSPPLDRDAVHDLLRARETIIEKLAGTLAHYRAWAAHLQARYQLFNPEAARPARRIYIGGLPPESGSGPGWPDRKSFDSNSSEPGTPSRLKQSPVKGPETPPVQTPLGPRGSLSSQASAMMPEISASSKDSGDSSSSMGAIPSGVGGIPEGRSLGGSTPDSPDPSSRVAAYASQLEVDLRHFINGLLLTSGGCAAPGYPITSCKVYPDRWYAFLEFRSIEEASNCMALDGVIYKGNVLRVRRPNNYDPDIALTLGLTEPDPTMSLGPQGLVRTVVPDSPHKIFLGGLPCDWSEEQVKDLLLPFGSLRAFNLVQDKVTGNSKGYAFCEYLDVGRTEHVIQSLNAKQIGKRYLTAKRAVAPRF